MATQLPLDPFRGFRFRVDILGLQMAAFSEVTIPEITVATVDYREGMDAPVPRTLSGLVSYGRVSLKKGMTTSTELYDWHAGIVQHGTSWPNAKRNVTIALLDQGGDNLLARWDVYYAWPTVLQTSGLNAGSADVMIETLELAIDSMVRAK
jgi:phage tail-like protein